MFMWSFGPLFMKDDGDDDRMASAWPRILLTRLASSGRRRNSLSVDISISIDIGLFHSY